MNKEYLIYKNNDVIVEDENGNKKAVEYQDNIYELLTQENLVEILEKELLDLEKCKNKTEKEKNTTKKFYLSPFYTGILGCITMPQIFNYILTNRDNPMVDTIFGQMSTNALHGITTSILVIPFCSLLSIIYYHDYKNLVKAENGLQVELSFLKEILNKEKAKLIELKNRKTDSRNNFETKLESIQITEPEKLKTINGYLNLYYDCGYNQKKYLKFYQKGILSIKLKKEYNSFGIKLIEEYVEEKIKEKSLVKGCN